MIEPITAWWIILVIFIINGVLLLNQFLDDKNYKTAMVCVGLYAFIFYCLAIIKGVLQ